MADPHVKPPYKMRRFAAPTELGEGPSHGGPPWLLLIVGVLLSVGVTCYIYNPLELIPQVAG
jgi:hypothetical protein